jgi:prepilin-type N-terminal cleavage/methylation domain-containing protein
MGKPITFLIIIFKNCRGGQIKMIKGRKSKGVTLLELLISIALLSIIVTPMFSLAITSAKINNNSGDKIQALALAQKHFEYLKSDYCDIDVDSDDNSFDYEEMDEDDLDSDSFDSDTSSRQKEYTIEGYTLKEIVKSIDKYEVQTSSGSNINISDNNNITVEIEYSNNKIYYTIWTESDSSTTLTYNYSTSDDPIELDIQLLNSNKIKFDNSNSLSGLDDDNVFVNIINESNMNIEITLKNNSNSYILYYSLGEDCDLDHDYSSDDTIMDIDEGGSEDLVTSFKVYKITLEVEDSEGDVVQTIEGYKPMYD